MVAFRSPDIARFTLMEVTFSLVHIFIIYFIYLFILVI